jgi:hypothetical protein
MGDEMIQKPRWPRAQSRGLAWRTCTQNPSATLGAIGVLWCIASPVLAAQPTPRLILPVACTIGRDCFVQKLFDLQPGPGRRDYRCGTLTTEDHDGVDMRVRTVADMARGVAVVAAASGMVLRVRDAIADANVRETGSDSVKNYMAGNGVVIDHGGGWQTQYSHLRRGSVRVKPGDTVAAGAPLGLVGMSGNAEFPHLHFQVRKDGVALDPFLAAPASSSCVAGTAPVIGLWTKDAAAALAYTPTGIIAGGFTAAPPEAMAMRAAQPVVTHMSADSAALVLWVDAYGVQANDEERTTLIGPDGQTILETRKTISKPALAWFAFAGKKRPGALWPAGRYTGQYQLLRAQKIIADMPQSITIDK